MSFTKAASCSLGNVVHLGNVHYVFMFRADAHILLYFGLFCSVHFTSFAPLHNVLFG